MKNELDTYINEDIPTEDCVGSETTGDGLPPEDEVVVTDLPTEECGNPGTTADGSRAGCVGDGADPPGGSSGLFQGFYGLFPIAVFNQIKGILPPTQDEWKIERILMTASCMCDMYHRKQLTLEGVKFSLVEAVKHWFLGTKNDLAENVANIAAWQYGVNLYETRLEILPIESFRQYGMYTSLNSIIAVMTQRNLDYYLRNYGKLPEPGNLESEMLQHINDGINVVNSCKVNDVVKMAPIRRLPPESIGMCLIASGNVARMRMCDGKYRVLFYHTDGEYKGLWRAVTDKNNEAYGDRLIRGYNIHIKKAEREEVYNFLKENAPIRQETEDPMIVAVNNGIWFYNTRTLLMYEECRGLTMRHKIQTNLNFNAQNVDIYNPEDGTHWDVESWMREFFDDPELVNALWCIIQAICRPYVNWKKTIWFTNTTGRGNNGKSTWTKLVIALVGSGVVQNIRVSDFEKEFALQGIVNAMFIFATENGVNKYVDEVANYKALATQDPIQINVKFNDPFSYVFRGLTLECFNDLPRIKDKSGSFCRRLYILDWTKCFTGREREYIVDDYITRPEVLEYVLKRVLVDMPPLKTLPMPQAIKDMADFYKKSNDPIERFMEEMALPDEDGNILLRWDMVPFRFLYDVYIEWYKKTENGVFSVGLNKFTQEVRNWAEKHPDYWEVTLDQKGKVCQKRVGNLMDKPEPLIIEYALKDWMNPTYNGMDLDRVCTPKKKDKYSGILRKKMVP